MIKGLNGLAAEVIVEAVHARAAWDATPEAQRKGRRDGAFILFGLSEGGDLEDPITYKPIPTGAPHA